MPNPTPDPATASPTHTRDLPLREAISRRAYEIWNENGRPHDRDKEFWLRAEQEVLGASGDVRLVEGGAVSAEQYTESTDANAAKRESGAE